MMTNFGSFGIVPSNFHPPAPSVARPIAREIAFPLLGTAGPNSGTYMPTINWLLFKWPELQNGKGGFYR